MHPESSPNPDRSLEALEEQLRALLQPPIPADLEARLLATIPAEWSMPRRRWGVRVSVIGALAAACLLAVIAWPRGDGENSIRSSETIKSAHQATSRPLDGSANVASLRATRQVLDEAEPPTFTWPLPEPSPIRFSTSIPSDLLD